MGELDNLKKILIQLEQCLDELKNSNNIPYKSPAQPSFSDVALNKKFKLDVAIPIILDDNGNYKAIRDVLFMGVCGFIASPKDDLTSELYMARGVIDHLFNNEFPEEEGDLSNFQYDALVRYARIGMDFFSDIYYPILGHGLLNYSLAGAALSSWFSEHKGQIEKVVLCCSIMHVAKDKFAENAKYHSISQNRVVKVLSSFPIEKRVSRSTLLAGWSQYREVMALLYAASTVHHKKTSLLEAIMSGDVCSSDYVDKFSEWMERSRYFCDHVLANIGMSELHKDNVRPLKDVKPRRFSAASFSAEEESIIIASFLKKMN